MEKFGITSRDLPRHHQIEDGLPLDHVVASESVSQSDRNQCRSSSIGNECVQQIGKDDSHEGLQDKIRALRAAVKHVRDESANIESFPSSKRLRLPVMTANIAAPIPRGTFHQVQSPASMPSLPPPSLEFSNIPSTDAPAAVQVARSNQSSLYTACPPSYRLSEQLQRFQVNSPPARAITHGMRDNVGIRRNSSQIYALLEHQAAEIAQLQEQLNNADQRFTRILARNHPTTSAQSPQYSAEQVHPFEMSLPHVLQDRTLGMREGRVSVAGMRNAAADAHLYSILEHQAAEIAQLQEQLNDADQRLTRILQAPHQESERLHHPFQTNRRSEQDLLLAQGGGRRGIPGMRNASSDSQLYSILENQAAEIAQLQEQLNNSDQRYLIMLACNNPTSAHHQQSPQEDQQDFDSNIHLMRHHAAATESKSLLRGNNHFDRNLMGNIARQLRELSEMPSNQNFLPAREALRLAQERRPEVDAFQRQQLATLGILPFVVNGTAPYDTHRQLPSNATGHHINIAGSPAAHALAMNSLGRNMTEAVRPMLSNTGSSSRPCAIDARQGSICMALDSDRENKLSEYQCMVRQHLEFFVAQEEDAQSNTQGRKKRIQLGQVGMRCRECAHLPLHSRGRGSVYYPSRLDGIYQAAQNMAATHLSESCFVISATTRETLLSLRERRETNSRRGKAYWAESCQQLGIYESEHGCLRLASMPLTR